jgi:hypothetical protein
MELLNDIWVCGGAISRRTPRPTLPVYGHCHSIAIVWGLDTCTLGQVVGRRIATGSVTMPLNGYGSKSIEEVLNFNA